jgi:ACS family tartrate transporter-like MFS transporter
MPDMPRSALDRARAKAYRRIIPVLWICYVVNFVDRVNVGYVKLTMSKDMPAFNDEVIGFGAGVFFLGYFLLEIPGALLAERWSARKWLSRIMVSWGILAALTAFVRVPWHFYTVRFLLGLAEAGFFPAIVVYLTHWFPSRDRARALAYFFVAIPTAQMLTPGMSSWLLQIGAEGNPRMLGLAGWQWVYIVWGLPAVLLGLLVLFCLTDRPGQARWLDADERAALEEQLKREKELRHGSRHITVLEALRNRKVLILSGAYFCTLNFTYGLTFFTPSILESWYKLKIADLTWLLILPSLCSFFGYLFVGWNSDRTQERRWHTAVPIYLGAAAMAVAALLDTPPLWVTAGLIIVGAFTSTFLPAFWALPNLFLTEAAAAGSIGFINSLGNLGGFLGPSLLGMVKQRTGDFRIGLVILACLAIFSGTVIVNLGLGKRPAAGSEPAAPDVLDEMLTGPI